MTRLLLAVLAAILSLAPVPALAQSSAQPVLPGLLVTSGCTPSTLTVCYKPYSASNPLPVSSTASGSTVTTSPLGATSTDASGTVTLGGTYQTVFASSTTRKGCLIQNPTTATEVLSVKVGTMASPFMLAAGATFSCSAGSGVVVTDAITLTAASTSHAFVAVSQ